MREIDTGIFPRQEGDFPLTSSDQTRVISRTMAEEQKSPIAQRVEARLAELGTTARAASLAVGDNPDLIRNILRTPAGSNPRLDTAGKAARALGWTVARLLTGRDDMDLLGDGGEIDVFDMPTLEMPDKTRMLEIRGTAMGSIIQEGIEGFHFEGSPIGYVKRPKSLLTIQEAYALIVTGDSMAPMHRPGETRIANPRRPTAPGDTVIAITKHWDDDPGQAYIKLLLRRTQRAIFLKQLNPEMTLEIPIQFVAGLHYVLTYDDIISG